MGLFDNFNSWLPANADDTEAITKVLDSLSPSTSAAAMAQQPAPVPARKLSGMEERAARVNDSTQLHGGRAVIGADGKVTLTNQNPDGSWNPGGELAKMAPLAQYKPALAMQQQSPGVPVVAQPKAPVVLEDLLTKIQATNDPISMRSHADSAKNLIVTEQTRLRTEALTFASTKLGIPDLELRYNQSLQNDAKFPETRALYGDSPATKQLRAALDGMKDLVKVEADKFLMQNPNYSILKNAEATVERETQRMQRINDRRLNFQEQKEFQQELEAEQLVMSLSKEQQERIQFFSGKDGTMTVQEMAAYAKGLKSAGKKQEAEAVMTPVEKLPQLALAGNKSAEQLFVYKESQATGASPETIRGKLVEMNRILNTPDLYKQAYGAAYNITGEALENEFKKQEGKAREATTAEDKQAASQNRYNTVLQFMKVNATRGALNDVRTLRVEEPSVNAAIEESMRSTTNAKIDNVLTAYLKLNGNPTGMQKMAKARELSDILSNAAAKNKDSVFGMAQPETIKAAIANAATGRGLWGDIVAGYQEYQMNARKKREQMFRQNFEWAVNPMTGQEQVVNSVFHSGKTMQQMLDGD